jgi:hypothetical protein
MRKNSEADKNKPSTANGDKTNKVNRPESNNKMLKISTPKFTPKPLNPVLSPINMNGVTLEPISTRNNQTKNPNLVDVMTLLSSQHIPISINTLKQNFFNFEASKNSNKSLHFVKAYAANTHQGTVRNYNEDRVSIILNIVKPNTYVGDDWPKCSIFGVFDGHGGQGCAEYLRDNLHQFVIKDNNFPHNPKEAIIRGFENCEKEFIEKHALNKNGDIMDRSGSCAVVTFIIDDICYVANVGDSRAVVSKRDGKHVDALTNDHKPSDPSEEMRIIAAGGKVYQYFINKF